MVELVIMFKKYHTSYFCHVCDKLSHHISVNLILTILKCVTKQKHLQEYSVFSGKKKKKNGDQNKKSSKIHQLIKLVIIPIFLLLRDFSMKSFFVSVQNKKYFTQQTIKHTDYIMPPQNMLEISNTSVRRYCIVLQSPEVTHE